MLIVVDSTEIFLSSQKLYQNSQLIEKFSTFFGATREGKWTRNFLSPSKRDKRIKTLSNVQRNQCIGCVHLFESIILLMCMRTRVLHALWPSLHTNYHVNRPYDLNFNSSCIIFLEFIDTNKINLAKINKFKYFCGIFKKYFI